MQSKTSYFNATLFRKNLTRFWPLWGLASFIGALFPLAVLLDMVHRGWNVLSAPDFTGMYYDAVSAVPVINLVYAALCAMAVWSYLYNARSVGLMHTLPIRREGLFLTNFLSGLSMTLIPYAVTGVLCVVVSLCGGAFDAKGLAVTVLAVLGEDKATFGAPVVEGAKVSASVVKNGKGKKVMIFKYNPKKGYRRRQGHRQPYTKVQIEKIEA